MGWGGVGRGRGGREGLHTFSTGCVEGRVEESWVGGQERGGEMGGGLEREGGCTHAPLSADIGLIRHWSRALLVKDLDSFLLV